MPTEMIMVEIGTIPPVSFDKLVQFERDMTIIKAVRMGHSYADIAKFDGINIGVQRVQAIVRNHPMYEQIIADRDAVRKAAKEAYIERNTKNLIYDDFEADSSVHILMKLRNREIGSVSNVH